jgi:aromatic ring-opening dioxygenase catalytic subunit (LigB family)
MEAKDRLPTLFIPHGGGPCFFMDPPYRDLWDGMAAYLRGIPDAVGAKPRALLVISGHWEGRPTVNVSPRPPLLFDYYGFPDHTYRLTYPAPGSPELAQKIRALLAASGIGSDEDGTRGLDHGVFVPFKLIYPDADIPLVQLSLQTGLSPAAHLAIGQALAPLRDEGVLIVGSGMSYHNLGAMFVDDPRLNEGSVRFDDWLTETACDPDPDSRNNRLAHWTEAPFARACHPREEHLAPIFVAAGAAADDRGVKTYGERILGKALSGFQFG